MRTVVALLLHLFPAEFRRAFGADLLATFEERWRESASWSLALRIIVDLIHNAAAERYAAIQRKRATGVRPRKGDCLMNTLLHDLRFAARLLLRSPGFTALVVIVLAIGIGANSAIFTLVDAALLRPLPFAQPEQLVMLWEHPPGYAHNSVAPLNFLDWSEQNQVFADMAAVSGGSRSFNTAGGAEKIPGQSVTASLFDVLGVKPIAGRTFTRDDAAQKSKVVVLSDRFWTSHFARNPTLVGNTIKLDGEPFTVIGIVPAQFQIFYKSDLWTPFIPKRSPEQRRMHYLLVIGRLKPGVTLSHASAGMGVIAENIARISPETNKDWGITIEPLRGALVDRDLRVTSLVLAGVTGFVLLLACANVANLLLARGAIRTREIAVRASLGGSQGRIVRQLLTESALLATLGGVAGIGLAWIVLRAAPSFIPEGLVPVSLQLTLDARVLGFAAALTIATGLLFGLAPAWHAARTPLGDALRAGGRAATGTAGAFRTILAAGEIAVAVLLASGAALLVRTLGSLNHVDPGYHATNVLTMNVSLPLSRYPTPERALQFYQAMQNEIRSVPGVSDVGLGTNLPLDGWDIGQGFHIIGQPLNSESNEPSAHYQMVNANYFSTLGIPLLKGRTFTEGDAGTSKPVCIVNEELARRYLKGPDPIGMRLSVQAMAPGGPRPVVREIVGVVRQVKIEGLGEKQNNLEIYVPITQNAWYWAAVAVRTAGDPMALAGSVRAAVGRVDKDLPVTRVRTMDEVAGQSIAQPRFRAELVGAFATLASVLASVGVFGVLAFSVSQRTREFGIRMALGARSADVLRLVLRGGLKIAAAGLAIGVAAAVALTRFLESLLFGVTPLDPISFLAAAALLLVLALAACAAPAVRAARVDPAVTLRQEW
jgi:predicted permease